MGMADEEELVAEDSSTLFTRGVREIVPWPVEILDLPDPTEPELLATGTSERHSAVGASNLSGLQPPLSSSVCACAADVLLRTAQERRRRQQEAGLILNRVVYDATHFVPASTELVPGGALLFESRFESGNLRRAIHVCGNEYDLLMNWDHGTRGHTQWFFFAVRGAVVGETYLFNIINFCKPQSLFRQGMLPLVYSARNAQERGVGWRRGGHDVLYFENGVGRRDKDKGSHRRARPAPPTLPRSPGPSAPPAPLLPPCRSTLLGARERRQGFGEGAGAIGLRHTQHERTPTPDPDPNRSTLSFCWSPEREGDLVYFAMCYPYTYTEQCRHLDAIEAHPLRTRHVRRELLAHTLAGNACEMLWVTDYTAAQSDIDARRVVAISARVHPGESNASFMMHGILDFLTGTSAEADALRRQLLFLVVPMLNPDGVIIGNYRCSLAAVDLNRR